MPIVAFAQTAAPAQVNTGNFFTRLYQAYVDDINAPNEAPTESRLSRIALTAATIERNPIISASKLPNTTPKITLGNCCFTTKS